MKNLLSGLAIAMMLASALAQAQDVVREQVLRSTTSWDGAALPAYSSGQPEITILRFTIPPGTTLASHKHSAINAGVLLSGTLKVVSEDQEVIHLNPGDALVELVGKWHHGENDGTEPAVILVFYAGIQGEKFTHARPDIVD